MKPTKHAGFTLLESLVTLGILGSTLIPLYMLFGSNIRTLLRVADINEQTLITQTILPMLMNVNPVDKPSGSKELPSFKFNWDAQPLTPESAIFEESTDNAPSTNQGNQQPAPSKQSASVQRVQLYNLTINVLTPEGKDWFSFAVRQLGWTRPPEEESKP